MIESSVETKNILGKMYSIMSDVDRIEKDRSNEHSRYRYASEKVIKEVLHIAFVNNGVVMQISAGSPRPVTGTSKDHPDITVCMAVNVHYRFYDTDTGEFIGGTFVGSGNARDDKGIYAAVTGAIKYILTSNFLIPTGDDPEDDFFDRYNKGLEKAVKSSQAEIEPAAKAEAIVTTKAAVASTPDIAGLTLLSEQQKAAIISNFDKLGIEIWDLEKSYGASDAWTIEDRRKMLGIFNAITSDNVNYSATNFLEGKLPA